MGRQSQVEDEARANLWLLLSSVATRFGREAQRGLAGCKLSMQGMRVLIYLLERQGLRCSSLANAVGLESTALSHLMRALADQGLITRTRATRDQRSIEVCLTPAGQLMAEQCRAANARTENLLFAGLDQLEVQTLHILLTQMNANLEAVGP